MVKPSNTGIKGVGGCGLWGTGMGDLGLAWTFQGGRIFMRNLNLIANTRSGL